MKQIYLILIFGGFLSSGNEIRSYRLSTEVIPSHYSIKIHPDIDNDVFDGEVSIYVRIRNILDKITLHSSQLNITEAFINQKGSKFEYEDNEKLSLQYPSDCIQPGEHILHIKYRGILQKKGAGFLKASFNYHKEQGFILVTDFEPTHARKVFPCFDEPSFKAKFSIRLIAPNNTYKAISNMPEINKFSTSKGVVYDFATTVMMSTYLVSFALTKYPYYEEILEEESGRKIPIRVYTFNASKVNNEYAIDCTKKAIQYYSKYTNISYPLSKLDMIEYQRPESAATENWGLITFREGLLTLNLDIYDKVQIKVVVYHELSHFWFGNLVTNEWWNDIWLQEGFATYMSYKLYKKDHEIQLSNRMYIFNGFIEIDSKIPTRPVVDYVVSHEDIKGRFTSTVYDKGAAIIFMIENIIGEELFQKVIQTFLNKYAYKTATTNDFISTIEDVVPDMNLRAFIESYVYQSRFPLIRVSGNNGTFVLKQEVCATAAAFAVSRQKWTIPITYVTDNNKNPKLTWFDKDMDSLTIDVPGAKWILLNSQEKGIYKVNFSTTLWNNLINLSEELTDAERETLVSDAVYSFRFDFTNCEVVFNLMKLVKSSIEWSCYVDFHQLIKERLLCNDYKEELSIYMNFLQKRFNETNYPRIPKAKDQECVKGEGILENDEQKEKLQICAKWIRENLISSSNEITGSL